MSTLTETLKDLKNMIVTSVSMEPCSENELCKRDFLKTTSNWGISVCVHDLLKEKKLFEKTKDGVEILYAYDSPLDKEDLIEGNLYQAKKRTLLQLTSGEVVYNDRRIVYMDVQNIQYDSPSIKTGKIRPIIPIMEFLNWVKADVTNEAQHQWVYADKKRKIKKMVNAKAKRSHSWMF